MQYECGNDCNRERVKKLITWYFDEQKQKIRSELSSLSAEEIVNLDDSEIMDAFWHPEVSRKAKKIFSFLSSNKNLNTYYGGMDIVVTGLDRYKLCSLAKTYNIDLSRYMFAVDMFENAMIESFNRKRKNS